MVVASASCVCASVLGERSLQEQWHALVRADSKEFVCGDIHLQVQYTPARGDLPGTLNVDGTVGGRIDAAPRKDASGRRVRAVIEGRNLPAKDANGMPIGC